MNISHSVSAQVTKISFKFYEPQDLKKLSVKAITNPQIFDTLDHPTAGGLYDNAMGPFDSKTLCHTCGLNQKSCPGHFGHIDLVAPVYNPITFRRMFKMLQSLCRYCYKLRLSCTTTMLFVAKFKLIHAGLLMEAGEIDDLFDSKQKFVGPPLDSEPDNANGTHDQVYEKEAFYEKIETYVKNALKSKRQNIRKNTLCTDALRKLEREFLLSIPSDVCANCKGCSPKYRPEGIAKIFEKPLGARSTSSMSAKGMRIPKLFNDSPDLDMMALKSENDTYITPLSVRGLLDKLWENEKEIMNVLYGASSKSSEASSPSMFFLDIVPVAPTRFRPVSKMNEIIKSNLMLQDLQQVESKWLESNSEVKEKIVEAKKDEFLKRKIEGWIRLQECVNNLIDSSKAPLGKGGKIAPPGIRQLLEKKEGLFRKHMMGKRVNYACRSVISPDPYIETNEIGIPPVFAQKLTYPEPVTAHNFKRMRECVINGPDNWPGATHVQNEDGTLIALSVFDAAGREGIANQLLTPSSKRGHISSHLFTNNNKKVYRHLRNGDFLLLNRQPTLHKPSIMAHTARVLPGEKTIRMHYANCNTYNADFDGDEMNAHFPQNEIARAEAMLIARTDQQYLVPTDGSVLRGLIQDHVDAGVSMCSRDSFFTREKYLQYVYSGLREANCGSSLANGNIETAVEIGINSRIQSLPPAIMKPYPLWTGKQIISTILLNLTPQTSSSLNLISKSKIPAKMWGHNAPEEQTVLILDGHLLTGILDKSQFGASSNGLVHAVFEVYGPQYAGKLLSILGRLFTTYLQSVGFSCRMDDLLLTPEGNNARKTLIDGSVKMGYLVASDYVKSNDKNGIHLGLEAVLRDSEKMAGLDSAMKEKTNKVTSEIISKCVPSMLYKPFPQNNLQVMTVSGAKGSSVNVSQISCLLGQQELEGKRVPTMVSGKTLPSFHAFDTSARSGGYITGRFLTGIKPQEYYFHCMAGREGLIDTAVKTSRSGYLQRCLIKHLEGLKVNYDHTVRDSDGSVMQFHYGEDSLDVCKQTTLRKFEFNALNHGSLTNRYSPESMEGKIDENSVKKFIRKNLKKNVPHDPVLNLFQPGKYIGAVSEKFRKELADYIQDNPAGLIKNKDGKKSNSWSQEPIPKEYFEAIMYLRYMNSLVQPGESVGLLAAQSIGEPSTQMTLNTFHFAGFGAKNVTLGIPRLREIIMTASSKLKTPLMRLPMKAGVSENRKILLCEEMSRLVLSQVMTGVTVKERLTVKTVQTPRQKEVTLTLHFWNYKDYLKQYNIPRKKLGDVIEKKFIPLLESAIAKELLIYLRFLAQKEDDIGKGVAERRNISKPSTAEKKDDSGDEFESDGEQGDGDITGAKSKTKHLQQSSYDDDDEDEDEDQEAEKSEGEQDLERDAKGRTREDRITDSSKFVSSYKFDEKNGEWCEIVLRFDADSKKILMAKLCETVCDKVVIHEVPGIQRCFPQPNETENDETVNIGTEGCNIHGVWNFSELIDIHKIYTNDISAILRTYGVEAARLAITQEIASVFAVYGIDVDSRHLSLIADYMTFEGGYKPFNRMGMGSNPSPFTQMSYERTTHFLTESTLAGDFDALNSPSAKIVMGQVVGGGTGCFDILQRVVK